MEGASSAEIEDLIEDAKALNEIDKNQFELLMNAHASGEFAVSMDGDVMRISKRFLEFLDEYQDHMEWIS